MPYTFHYLTQLHRYKMGTYVYTYFPWEDNVRTSEHYPLVSIYKPLKNQTFPLNHANRTQHAIL